MNYFNYLKSVILFFTVITFSNACKKPANPPPSPVPSADFNYTGANVFAPATVTFTNASANATSYAWDFGDGTTSTSASPQHAFTNGGVYNVRLTATGAGGNHSISKPVTILNKPTTCKITSIKLTDMPFVNGSGVGWDGSSGADVFFKITDANNTVFVDATANRFNDITLSSLPLTWNFSTPFIITPLNTDRFVDAWDYDFPDADDLIGWVQFNPSSYPTYPSSVNLTKLGVSYTLTLQWQ